MSVGQGALMGDLSYLLIGREITYGTYVTATAATGGLNFLSASFKTTKEVKILEEIQGSRTNSNSIQLGKSIEGSVEFYFSPKSLAANYLLHNAFGGGPVTSSVTATGETVGGLGMVHTVNIANFDTTYNSLCINMRKGDSIGAKIFEYKGLRVNEISFTGELDEALKCNASMVGQDSSLTTNDLSASIVTNSHTPLSFVNGRLSVEGSPGSLTSTSFWHVQKFELKIKNNLKSDSDVRRIGSDTIGVLPAGLAQFEFKATIRFDTSTAYAAMLAGTRLAAEVEFLGDTLSGSVAREGIKFTMPYVLITDSGDPEVGGPNDVLTSEVTFAVLRDPTSSGYALKAVVTNLTANYN